jgi:Fic family protein
MKQPKTGPPRDVWLEAILPDLFKRIVENPALVNRANDQCWNWDDCRYRAVNENLTPVELWGLIKFSRLDNRISIPLKDKHGRLFTYKLSAHAQRMLHLIDMNLGGGIQSAIPNVGTPDEKQRFLISSLYEESIASSQIEGAAVTRSIAKEMLRSGRKPRTLDERMIVNNYRTITTLNQLRGEPLTIALLLKIHAILTEGTLDKPDAVGRFRNADESIMVWDEEDHEPLHVPPHADELPSRLQALCDFANGTESESADGFIHPAVRAIALHFWLGYDHPFVDGNGRTARALFYWSMLRHGYWLTEYLSVSTILRKKTKQYPRAYLNSELDDNDFSYFLGFHLRVIEESIGAFRDYIAAKRKENQRLKDVVQPAQFNERQQAILRKALAESETRFTYQSHASSHGIVLATARTDLLDLVERGLLRKNASGRRFEFVAAADLQARLHRLSNSGSRADA